MNKKNLKNVLVILILILFLGQALAAPPIVTQIFYEPSPALPGSTINVIIQVENDEDITQNDVIIELENKYPFEIKEDLAKNVGNITKFGQTLTQFKIYVDPSAQKLEYDLPIKVYSKEQPNGKTINKKILVSGKEPILKITNVSDQRLIPGQEKEIELTIMNIGTSPAHDIIVELKEDRTIIATGAIIEREITPLGSAIIYIQKLEPKQEINKKIKISVNSNASLKNYTLPITITYNNDAGEKHEQTTNTGFKIAGQVNFDVILKEEKELILGENELVFEVFNKGVGKAEFTIITITTDIGTINKPKQFIGTLAPNDVDSFKLNLNVNKNTQTNSNIILNIEYQDTDAIIKTREFVIPVIVNENAKNNNINLFQIIILIALILIIAQIGIKYIKNNKKKN